MTHIHEHEGTMRLSRLWKFVLCSMAFLLMLALATRLVVINVQSGCGERASVMQTLDWRDKKRNASVETINMLEDTVDEEMLLLSEHPDIDIRGKFQQKRVAQLCAKYKFPDEQHFPTAGDESWQFRRHLIFDDNKMVIYCFVPKVGCTDMKRLLLYMSGHIPLSTIDWEWVEDSIYLEPALKHASFLNNTLTAKDRQFRLQNYYKFMIVRNPLERIVSGFRNKIKPPLKRDPKAQDKFPESIKRDILQKYRQAELLYWLKSSRQYNLSVTFPEFVRYLIDFQKSDMNEHFSPSMQICHPCLIKYHFYGNFKNYSHDATQLVKRFKTNPQFYRDKSLHSSSEQTARYLEEYYSKLAHRDRVELLGAWYDELAFYYALYPSERHSHIKLLGTDIPVI